MANQDEGPQMLLGGDPNFPIRYLAPPPPPPPFEPTPTMAEALSDEAVEAIRGRYDAAKAELEPLIAAFIAKEWAPIVADARRAGYHGLYLHFHSDLPSLEANFAAFQIYEQLRIGGNLGECRALCRFGRQPYVHITWLMSADILGGGRFFSIQRDRAPFLQEIIQSGIFYSRSHTWEETKALLGMAPDFELEFRL